MKQVEENEDYYGEEADDNGASVEEPDETVRQFKMELRLIETRDDDPRREAYRKEEPRGVSAFCGIGSAAADAAQQLEEPGSSCRIF